MLFTALMKSITCTSEPICCTPDQWEASMFWDNGNAFIDGKEKLANPAVGTAFSYINGTLKTAYDFTNGRTFINASIIEISPLIPKPVIDHTTLIRDYKNVRGVCLHCIFTPLIYANVVMLYVGNNFLCIMYKSPFKKNIFYTVMYICLQTSTVLFSWLVIEKLLITGHSKSHHLVSSQALHSSNCCSTCTKKNFSSSNKFSNSLLTQKKYTGQHRMWLLHKVQISNKSPNTAACIK